MVLVPTHNDIHIMSANPGHDAIPKPFDFLHSAAVKSKY